MSKTTRTGLNVVLLDLEQMTKRIAIHHDALSFAQEALQAAGAPRYAAAVDAAMQSAYEALEALLQARRELGHALTT